MRLAIFGKDGTLVRSALGEEFIQSPIDQEIIQGAAQLVRNRNEQGWNIIIASNQGGLESGRKSLKSAIEEMRFCLRLFPEIDWALFAPKGTVCFKVERDILTEIHANQESADHPLGETANIITCQEDYGSFQIPGPGMLKFAMDQYQSSWSETEFISNRYEDQQAAKAAGVKFTRAADLLIAINNPGKTATNFDFK